jgi:hypothetical protein
VHDDRRVAGPQGSRSNRVDSQPATCSFALGTSASMDPQGTGTGKANPSYCLNTPFSRIPSRIGLDANGSGYGTSRRREGDGGP